MIWAQLSVIFAELISYPGDTIKRKLFMQSLKENKSYSTIRKCVATIYEKEGIVGFWAASYSNILRGIGSSLCLLLYDEIKDMQHKYITKKH
jgi:solute carrier family 25 (adenine nucleotide translocator) protein 4/5/6/31